MDTRADQWCTEQGGKAKKAKPDSDEDFSDSEDEFDAKPKVRACLAAVDNVVPLAMQCSIALDMAAGEPLPDSKLAWHTKDC